MYSIQKVKIPARLGPSSLLQSISSFTLCRSLYKERSASSFLSSACTLFYKNTGMSRTASLSENTDLLISAFASFPLSFLSFRHSFAQHQISHRLFSSICALFQKMDFAQLVSFQLLPHSFAPYRGCGVVSCSQIKSFPLTILLCSLSTLCLSALHFPGEVLNHA